MINLAELYADPFQIAYLSADVENAVEVFDHQLGIAPFDVQRDFTLEGSRGGEPSSITINLALTMMDDTMIEIIEPVSGDVDVYTETLPGSLDDGVSFHHVGVLFEGHENLWPSLEESLSQHGHTLEFAGTFPDTANFAYLDMSSTLGHVIEIVEFLPGGQTFLDGIPRSL